GAAALDAGEHVAAEDFDIAGGQFGRKGMPAALLCARHAQGPGRFVGLAVDGAAQTGTLLAEGDLEAGAGQFERGGHASRAAADDEDFGAHGDTGAMRATRSPDRAGVRQASMPMPSTETMQAWQAPMPQK